MKPFSAFINEQNLNADQIAFVDKVIDYIVQNGYVESVAELTKPPFDKPQSLSAYSTISYRRNLCGSSMNWKENATKVIS